MLVSVVNFKTFVNTQQPRCNLPQNFSRFTFFYCFVWKVQHEFRLQINILAAANGYNFQLTEYKYTALTGVRQNNEWVLHFTSLCSIRGCLQKTCPHFILKYLPNCKIYSNSHDFFWVIRIHAVAMWDFKQNSLLFNVYICGCL